MITFDPSGLRTKVIGRSGRVMKLYRESSLTAERFHSLLFSVVAAGQATKSVSTPLTQRFLANIQSSPEPEVVLDVSGDMLVEVP